MQQIASTNCYTLTVDTIKNRIYWTITGNGLVRNTALIQDWQAAKRLVSQGFTVLTDLSQIQSLPEDWVEISINLQNLLVQEGLAGIAKLLSKSVVEKLHIDHISRFTRLLGNIRYTKEEIFTDRTIAEAWLDKIATRRTSQ
jgi:hypothetical protein